MNARRFAYNGDGLRDSLTVTSPVLWSDTQGDRERQACHRHGCVQKHECGDTFRVVDRVTNPRVATVSSAE